MTAYPVHYRIDPPARFTRLQLALRVVAFLALGTMGVPVAAFLLFAYLALPVLAASRLASGVSPETYEREDAQRILAALRWLAAVFAWAGLVADRLPVRTPGEIVTLTVDRSAHPTARSAAWRVLAGLPSALVLGLVGCLGALIWLWAALTILFTERVGPGAFAYLSGVQRWMFRLLAYQASLVEEYPPFSFEDASPEDTGMQMAR